MRYTVIIDNMSINMNVMAEWGYSALLQSPHGSILFDTGMRGSTLASNYKALKLPPADHIVLSHGHNDHCGGLAQARELFPNAAIWASPKISVKHASGPLEKPRFSGGFDLQELHLHPVNGEQEIVPGVLAFVVPVEIRDPRWIWRKDMWETGSDGELKPDSFADDLSMLVKGDKGISLLLGCAHTGLPNILRYVKEHFGIDQLYTVLGGMHLSPVKDDVFPEWMDALRCVAVNKWCPCHCTGFRAAAYMARVFENVNWAGAGSKIDL